MFYRQNIVKLNKLFINIHITFLCQYLNDYSTFISRVTQTLQPHMYYVCHVYVYANTQENKNVIPLQKNLRHTEKIMSK